MRAIGQLFLWVLASLSVIGAAAAQTPQPDRPDARILIIDMPYFAAIDSLADRQRAIGFLRSDIEMFDAAETQVFEGGVTLVLVPRGPNLARLATVPAGERVAVVLAATPMWARMEQGRMQAPQPIDVFDVASEVFDRLGILGMRGTGAGSDRHVVDMHVFAPGWRIGRADPRFGNLMGWDHATECVLRRDPPRLVWPEDADLRVEFRPPEGVEPPSPSAQAAFIGVLTGLVSHGGNIQSRGAVGPRCEMGVAEPTRAFTNPSGPDAVDCPTDAERRGDSGDRVQACVSAAPRVASLGAGLDRGPVSVILRPQEVTLAAPELSGSLTVGAVDVQAQIGGVGIVLGQTGTAVPSQPAAPGAFEFSAQPGCPAGVSGEVRLGAGTDTITAILSRFHCREARREIGEVTLQ
ncbi:MAG: hypothetical protein AAF914_08925 [Pseudomonadota bacterium]